MNNHNLNTSYIKPFVLTNIVKKYTNLENEKKGKIRELKDASTKCFVNIFFDSCDILLKFIFWVYHKINCRLIEIERINCKPDEKIIFFFKGGNIMFLWRKIFEEIYGGSDKDIMDKTSISDSDFAISILTKDERRYNEIYSKIHIELINQLEEIGIMFDTLFSQSISPPGNLTKSKNNLNKNNYTNANSVFDCKEFKKNEKKIFDNFFRDFYTKLKIDNLLQDIKDKLEELRDTDNNFYEEKNYKIFRYNIPDNFDININIRQSLILRPEDEVPNSFSLINFANTKLHYVTVNTNIFNNLSRAGHLVGFDLYRIKFNTVITNILKSEKINPNSNSNNFNKLSLQENFGIPSEFIDISVSKYYDLNLQKLREDFYDGQNKNSVISNKFATVSSTLSDGTVISSIRSMQIKYIIDDLLITLFLQNSYSPIIDPKYEKRLFRVFFFYIGNNFINGVVMKNNLFEKLNSDSEAFYSLILSSSNNLNIDDIKNMMGKLIYNFFNIKPLYDDLGYLLQFTILFDKILNNDILLEKFIKYYNNIYNIKDNINIDDFRKKFKKFKQDLDNNYKKAFNYFITNLSRITKLPRKYLEQSKIKIAGGGKGKEKGKEKGKGNNEAWEWEVNNQDWKSKNNMFSEGNTPIINRTINSQEQISENNKSYTNKEISTILKDIFFKIDDKIILEYKNDDIKIGKQEKIYYPSFEFDDNM